MQHQKKINVFWRGAPFRLLAPLCLFTTVAFAKTELLPLKKLDAVKKQSCSFLHVWATWCTICVEEMPELLKALKTKSKIHPVIIDVSPPDVQESESKAWMEKLNPGFTTFLKPGGEDSQYMETLDPKWTGTLPYTAVYHRGKLKKVWTGSLNLQTIANDIVRLCK